MRAIITTSRYWNNPQIRTVITDDFIALRMTMDDFVNALKREMEAAGPIWRVVTQAELEKRVDAAVLKIIEGVKEESAKAV